MTELYMKKDILAGMAIPRITKIMWSIVKSDLLNFNNLS